MEIFRFLKTYCPIGNGDLTFLYAFRRNWKFKTPELAKQIGISTSHANKILKAMQAKGYCKCYYENNKRVLTWKFNNEAKKVVKKIFERKIMPYVPLTPKEFLRTEEIDIVIKYRY